ncbi:MAG: hypothetical protein FWD57_00540 [Polyangiaceae bacterium]|nr:hypothetical protein [Polyangiaceae bacterium]
MPLINSVFIAGIHIIDVAVDLGTAAARSWGARGFRALGTSNARHHTE